MTFPVLSLWISYSANAWVLFEWVALFFVRDKPYRFSVLLIGPTVLIILLRLKMYYKDNKVTQQRRAPTQEYLTV